MQEQIGKEGEEGEVTESDSSLLHHLFVGKERLNQLLDDCWEGKIGLFRH